MGIEQLPACVMAPWTGCKCTSSACCKGRQSATKSDMSDAQSGGVKKFVTFFQMERAVRPTRCKKVGGGRDHTGMRSSSSSEPESDSRTEIISGLGGGRWMVGREGCAGERNRKCEPNPNACGSGRACSRSMAMVTSDHSYRRRPPKKAVFALRSHRLRLSNLFHPETHVHCLLPPEWISSLESR